MSTLFESYYDCLGHELSIGETVGWKSLGRFIFGTITEFVKTKTGDFKAVCIPNIGNTLLEGQKLRKKYSVNSNNIFKINIKK